MRCASWRTEKERSLFELFFAGCTDELAKCHVYYIVHSPRRLVKWIIVVLENDVRATSNEGES